ncbi:Ficolin-2 [Lamellibrachia satsuma]|nr:Ficolin-2 [Lamellibrachia satsuma]
MFIRSNRYMQAADILAIALSKYDELTQILFSRISTVPLNLVSFLLLDNKKPLSSPHTDRSRSGFPNRWRLVSGTAIDHHGFKFSVLISTCVADKIGKNVKKKEQHRRRRGDSLSRGADVDQMLRQLQLLKDPKHHIIKPDTALSEETRRNAIKMVNSTFDDVVNLFQDTLRRFRKHIFNIRNQYKYYRMLRDNLENDECLIHVDFSENYVCRFANEIQSVHFGAFHLQATLHTGYLYVTDRVFPFYPISDSRQHDLAANGEYLQPTLDWTEREHRTIAKAQCHCTNWSACPHRRCLFVVSAAPFVFQRRQDGSVDFWRDWASYKKGFGNASGEFWLGNDYLHDITSQAHYTLRIDLGDVEGATRYAVYSSFAVASEGEKYKLSIGGYSGTSGDSFSPHNDRLFSTKDRDNDRSSQHCAQDYNGGWWYRECYYCNLNGRFLGTHLTGLSWHAWHKYESLKTVDMKLRP